VQSIAATWIWTTAVPGRKALYPYRIEIYDCEVLICYTHVAPAQAVPTISQRFRAFLDACVTLATMKSYATARTQNEPKLVTARKHPLS
jgi:hypothetical protein